jgi:hypothetical protein
MLPANVSVSCLLLAVSDTGYSSVSLFDIQSLEAALTIALSYFPWGASVLPSRYAG